MSEEAKKFFCNECQQETKHSIKGVFQKCENDRSAGIVSTADHYIAECCGCENVSFIQENRNSESGHLEYNDETEQEEYVPDVFTKIYPFITKRYLPKWFDDLPDNTLKIVMRETYQAFNAGSLYLATFGSRTIIDRLILLSVDDQGSFKKGLRRLEEDKKISAFEIMQLEPIIDAGHAAAHRGWFPNESQLSTMLDTIENLIYRLLVLPKLSEELKDSIPDRFAKGKKQQIQNKKGIVTAEEKVSLVAGSLRKLFHQLTTVLEAQGEDVSMHHKKHYTAFRRKRNFASVQLYLQKEEIKVYVNIDPDDVDLVDGFSRDVRTVGHYGTGDLEIIIKNFTDLEKAQELFQQSYNLS